MKKTAKIWQDDFVDISKLKLDLQNPRLPQHVKEHQDGVQIRNYLLDKEGVTRIARSIANNGYHHSAVSIVYEDVDGKLIVLDGNRRLAASQFLDDPTLVPDSKDRREYEGLNKKLSTDFFSKIHIAIAPSRRDAEKEIWDIHVSPLSKPWEVLQKLRMYRNLIETGDYTIESASHEYGITEAKFKNELARLFIYEQILSNASDAEEDELLKSGFNKIQRIALSTNGKKLLGVDVNDKGKIEIENQKSFDSTLSKITPYITDPNKVTAQAKQSEIYEHVYSEIDPVNFPKTQLGSQSPKLPTPTTGPSKLTTPGSLTKPAWITDGEYKAYVGEQRVKALLEELKKNPPTRGQNLNMVSVSLRVVIELAIYDALKKRGSIATIKSGRSTQIATTNAQRAIDSKPPLPQLKSDWTPSLNEMLAFMLVEANGIITDPQERRALSKVVATRKVYISDMNSFMHNVSFVPTEQITKDIWESFGRPMFDIIKKI